MKLRDGRIIAPMPCSTQPYATFNNMLFHRLVAEAFPDIVGTVSSDQSMTVDHINRNRRDNRAVNLRWATKSEQAFNRCTCKC